MSLLGLPLRPTAIVGSYPQPDWLIDREGLKSRLPPRVRAKELWRIPEALLCRIGLPLDAALTLRDDLKKLISILQHAAPHSPACIPTGEPA